MSTQPILIVIGIAIAVNLVIMGGLLVSVIARRRSQFATPDGIVEPAQYRYSAMTTTPPTATAAISYIDEDDEEYDRVVQHGTSLERDGPACAGVRGLTQRPCHRRATSNLTAIQRVARCTSHAMGGGRGAGGTRHGKTSRRRSATSYTSIAAPPTATPSRRR